ncbi:MAG: hypothetical protein ACE362_28595 [Phaeodactylibacter xiamenensis]|nr:hypothetical protein [Phaeodactylibacter xiamenensis]MCR9055099.1 hypothetical protein [bacterium]
MKELNDLGSWDKYQDLTKINSLNSQIERLKRSNKELTDRITALRDKLNRVYPENYFREPRSEQNLVALTLLSRLAGDFFGAAVPFVGPGIAFWLFFHVSVQEVECILRLLP